MAGDILQLDATGQLVQLAAKRISALELLKAVLARHEQTHHRINAVVTADLERAIERARAIDDARARHQTLGPLAGLPMTVKDTLDVAGMPASAGLASLRRRMAEDAEVVASARRAGAVIWGKTNTPVMAGDWQTYNRLYGTTNNPWDATRTSGGSSGGAAAAVAAQVTALEIGSDIGGSLRVPASFCGVFSHKPSWGVIPQRGHVPPRPGSWVERDLNVIGPIARSARDLRLLLSVIGQLAPKAPPADLKATRVGLWLESPGFPLDPEARQVLEAFAGELAAAGCQVTPIPCPVDPAALLQAYGTLLGGVLGEDLPPGQLLRMQMLRGPARLALAAGADPLSLASAILAYTATHREWMTADAVRARLRHDIAEAFASFEVILAPAAPVAAFPHDHRPFERRRLTASDGTMIRYNAMLCWIAMASALGLPVTTVPAGLTAGGLPVGAQLIGAPGDDARTLALAQAVDEVLRGFVPPPLLP